MSKFKRIFIYTHFVLVLICYPLLSYAEWKGPEEVIVGTWGADSEQFYFKAQDTADLFPKNFVVDKDGNIIIRDEGNFRILIYSQVGQLKNVIKKPSELPETDTQYYWPWGIKLVNNNWIAIDCDAQKDIEGKYTIKKCFLDYNGKIVKKTEWGEIFPLKGGYFLKKDNKYNLYSPTGQLLETHKEKPLELGVVDTKKIRKKQYKVTIKYPDKTYQFTGKRFRGKHFRDAYKNLYWVENFVERVKKEDIISYRVFICNACDDNVSLFNMPQSQYEPQPENMKGAPTWVPVPIIEYGEPIASLAGNIYCWARTKTEYKILKWTWQGEPDAPQSLKANSRKKSSVLTWQKPVEGAATVTAYEIYRSSDVCGPLNKIKKVKKGVLQYTDKKVKEGETYYYQVCAERGSGYSGYSNKAVGSIKD